jgi:hypothetical protein
MKKSILCITSLIVLFNFFGCKKESLIAEKSTSESKTSKPQLKPNQVYYAPLLQDPDDPNGYIGEWHGVTFKVWDVIWNQSLYPNFDTGVPVLGQMAFANNTSGTVTLNNPSAGIGTVFVVIQSVNQVVDFGKLHEEFDTYNTAVINNIACSFCNGFISANDYLSMAYTPGYTVTFSGKLIRHTGTDTGLAITDPGNYPY